MKRILMGGAAVLLLAQGAVFGGQINAHAQLGGVSGLGDTNILGCSDFPGVQQGSGSASAACSGTSLVTFGPLTGTLYDMVGSASASAGPNPVLHAEADISLSNAPWDTFHSGPISQGEVNLALSFNPLGAMPTLYIQFQLAADGSTSTTGDGGASGVFTYSSNLFVEPFLLGNGTTDIVTTPLAWDPTQNFFFNFDLNAGAWGCASCIPNSTPAHTYNASASANYGNTVTLTGIEITDAAGAPVNVRLSSPDGIDYNALLNGVAATPEPGTVWIGAAGIGLLLGVRRKRVRGLKARPTAAAWLRRQEGTDFSDND